jgi:hypothetical protein
MFNNKFSRLLPHPGYNIGGGIGEAALIGAAFSGGKALITGEDPLQAAVLGGITGGAMSGLTQGAQGLLGATNTSAAAGGIDNAITPLPPNTVADYVPPPTAVTPPPVVNNGIASVGQVTGPNGQIGVNLSNAPSTPGGYVPGQPAQLSTGSDAMEGKAVVGRGSLANVPPEGVELPFDRIKAMVNPEAGGTLDKAFNFANANPGPAAGIAGALYGAAFPKKMDEEKEDEEKSPLAGYDRADFTAYEAPRPDPYPQAQYTDYFKYGKEGGVMQSYAGGGIASLAAGGAMAGQSYPQGLLDVNHYSTPSSTPSSMEVVSGGYEPQVDTYTGSRVGPGMAEGGVARFFGGGTGEMYGNSGGMGGQVYYDSNTGQYYTLGNSVGMGAMGFGNRSRNILNKAGSKLSGDVDPSVGENNVAPIENYYKARYSEPTTPIQYSGPQGGVANYYSLANSVPLLAASNPGIGAQYTPASMASGGIAGYSLGGYAAGGNPRLLKGPGDGMSDNIPATIGGKQPARLADGEFVVPADVVSHLGNGSTDAGAKHLYNMMDKVRKARTGNKKQGKQINPSRFMPR